jgi:hypothetical protein
MPALHAPEADLADSKQFREAGSKSVFAEHDAGGFVYDLNLLLTERCIGHFGRARAAISAFSRRGYPSVTMEQSPGPLALGRHRISSHSRGELVL